jgi:hypothetical protein
MEKIVTPSSEDVEVSSDEFMGNKRLHVLSAKSKEVHSAVCLPDAVDPRDKH